jgi:hypothetical protein
MSDFLKTWEQTKKQFSMTVLGQLQAGGGGVPDDVKKNVIALVKLQTGLTPALKLVDAAFAKGHRATVMQALTKVHLVIEKNTKIFQNAAISAMNASNEKGAAPEILDIATTIKDFNSKVIRLETEIAKKLEKLQDVKGGKALMDDGEIKPVHVNIISLEGDFKGGVEKFKKDIKDFSALEKKFKVMDRVDKASKAMRTYSDAAARTQVKGAREALEEFFSVVDEIDKYRKQVENDKSKPDEKYLKATELLCTSLKAIRNTRGKASLENLKQLEASGA